MAEAFPLEWPPGWPRTKVRHRARFAERKFRTTTYGVDIRSSESKSHSKALRFLLDELERLGARDVVISTNLELRRDGLPRSTARADDPGVAVYFTIKGQTRCIPCDRWDRVPDNLYAVGLCIAAMRGLERWGAGKMVDAAFSGFKALLAQNEGYPWWTVLGFTTPDGVTKALAEDAYVQLAQKLHPDVGGSHDDMVELNQARADALAYLEQQ